MTAPISPDWDLYESVVYVYTIVFPTCVPRPDTAMHTAALIHGFDVSIQYPYVAVPIPSRIVKGSK